MKNSGYIQANTMGKLHDAREASLSPLDRGFLYGDAIYEVWRTYDSVLFAMEAHWERLIRSALGIGMAMPLTADSIMPEIRKTVKAWRSNTGMDSEVYVRLQISRGAGEIGLNPTYSESPNWVILVKALHDLSPEALDRGYSVGISRSVRRNPRWALSPELKTGNYLNNIMGFADGLERGRDEVLMLNGEGLITEGTTRNIWLVLEDRVAGPRQEDGILGGVTRGLLLRHAGEFSDLPFTEEPLHEAMLSKAREVFFSSTTQDIQPVACVDNLSFKTGPATITRSIKNCFRRWISEYNRTHSHWKVDA
ncbi:MAG: aminotransferase class IV [Opitutales bacterium]|nr:aminotransferase class IV [Opitutales bacterium]